MDDKGFDALARALHDVTGRREILRTAWSALALGGGIAALPALAEGRKRHGKKRRRRKRQCSVGLTRCGGSCVNTSSDRAHCGRCFQDCDNDETCQSGVCARQGCPAGLTRCGGSCVNTNSDHAHCGRCFDDCDDDETCQSGTCQKQCPDDLEFCAGLCVDTSNDRLNCGRCGNRCDANESCHDNDCETCDVCASGCAFTSLQAAIVAGTASTIRICPGAFVTNDVTIDRSLRIVGAGSSAGGTILDGQGLSRVLLIADGTTVTIQDLTITRGRSSDGGGIRNEGTLTLERVQVTDSTSPLGGGINNVGTLTLIASRIANNSAEFFAGGISNAGTLRLVASRIEGNTALLGGGINNFQGDVTLSNGTVVTRNTATDGPGSGGGILHNEGTLTGVNPSTVFGNIPDDCFDFVKQTAC